MLNDNEKLQIVSEILESPDFKESKRYRELLQYLVRETLSGSVPKEITIGIAFFHKASAFDPKEDPTVRVYLNNLRRKIEHYYLTSGKEHSHKLEIPKGRYEVEFTKVEQASPQPVRRKHWLWAAILSAATTIAVGVTLYLVFREDSPEREYANNPVWTEFMQSSGRPTLVVLGDFFFLFERTGDGKTRNFVRNLNINSSEDFKAMVKQDPNLAERYVQSDFTFLRPSASWGLAELLPVLQNSPNGFALKLASQFTVDDLKSNNIIFVGSFKTMYTLHKFLHIFGLEYRLSPSQVEVRSGKNDSTRIFSPTEIKGGSYEKDYAVVAKGTGPSGSTMLLLLGFSDSGVIEATKAVTDPRIVAIIAKELAKPPVSQPFHFTLVVDTEGFKQAIFKSQVRYFIQHRTQP